jgi:TonB family protein
MYARFCVLGVGLVSSFPVSIRSLSFFLPTILVLINTLCAFAQSSVVPESAPTVDPIQAKIERARALAAAHQLQTAALELENVRAATKDVTIRNATTLMLMSIYLEDGNYGRAQTLLEENFQARLNQKDESIRTYFALAGQAIIGLRGHVDRYRNYGINPSDREIPAEAVTDLDRVKNMLERMIVQAKDITKDAGRSYDALALLEDLLGIRLSLARNNEDRDKWQAEYMSARERLAASQVQVASIGRAPALSTRIPNPFATKPAATTTTTESAPAQEEPAVTQPSPSPQTQAAQATPGNEPKLISTGSLSGRENKRVTPTYPVMAKQTGVVGTVRVFAIVDEHGKVWVTHSEGPTLLRRAAEDAAKNWSFPPTIVSGKTVRVAGYIDFDFKL